MSVKYIPVQWNRNKWLYDGIMLTGVVVFLWMFLFISPELLNHEFPINAQIHNARAFGACAFVMLTVILCIGPLARIDRRFLPLLYNRRHFGVMTLFVAITHASYILNWYFAFSSADKYETLLFSNTSYGQLAGFPFEVFGVFALICLAILATTSHDFWLKFMTPPVWKRLHSLIYFAYVAVVAHVSLGVLQDAQNQTFAVIFIGGALAVAGLHAYAALLDMRGGDAEGLDAEGWVDICDAADIADGFAKVVILPGGDRVAVFRQGNRLNAISNACAHQNGPLGEGRVLDCLVTCPWHGFQYDVTNGRSPAPFTEMLPTYNLRLSGRMVQVQPDANPPGTFVEPVTVEAMA
ncbi:Ferredoxin subunit of nitrite reductase or a ring-hydroxylating dioxygenase [Jannaschia faecimaris]|uniref:Ferredoxin subunit of nitrite reductase or a ring-hydroxylating dioxygenase n=1 Tax=Jannaschia faecimaris TaxID=1244108 RepID=A0A1H3UJ04_9RHOB|nr:Rieske 2Fe-2S domain-containing protein [Jannaschia faecimaris]SDZ61659.1 Ferredoxin subunit of nitrite reductase or a ring-hydroxylating dioxygenase [Jannaschia faecimaris]